MYDVVVFDLDGTLLDTIADLAAAGNHVCRSLGWPTRTEDGYRRIVGHGMANFISRLIPPEVNSDDALREEALRLFNAHYGDHCCDETRPCPGIPALLARLQARQIRMAVCSNKPDVFSQPIIAHFFPGVFALVRGKLPDIPVKPDPAGVLGMLRELDAAPERTLFVGDSSVDVETGHNAGLSVCGVSWGFRPRETLRGAEFLCDTPEELEQVILTGNRPARTETPSPDRKGG